MSSDFSSSQSQTGPYSQASASSSASSAGHTRAVNADANIIAVDLASSRGDFVLSPESVDVVDFAVNGVIDRREALFVLTVDTKRGQLVSQKVKLFLVFRSYSPGFFSYHLIFKF